MNKLGARFLAFTRHLAPARYLEQSELCLRLHTSMLVCGHTRLHAPAPLCLHFRVSMWVHLHASAFYVGIRAYTLALRVFTF